MTRRPVEPPSGMAPPAQARLADGRIVNLLALAEEITDRHLADHPEEVERYGDAGRAWGIHDNQHLLNWAILDARGVTSLVEQVQWLARVLDARGYPLPSLRDDLLTAAAVLREQGDPELEVPAERLAAAAAVVL